MAGLCAVMGVALQIQTTLFSSDGYLGLRISAADLILPFAGVFILVTLQSKTTQWPKWALSKTYFWIAGLTAVLVLSAIHAHFLYGHIGTWALGNKIGGWPVLIAFLLMGGWIGTNAKETHIQFFIKGLLYFALTVFIYQYFFAIAQSFYHLRLITGNYQYIEHLIPGLMKNRNAYALLMITVYGFVLFQFFSPKKFISSRILNLYLFLLPGFIIFNASRAGILALIILIPLTLIVNRFEKEKIKRFFFYLFLGGGFLLMCLYGKAEYAPLVNDSPKEIFHDVKIGQSLPEIRQNIEYSGDNMRLTILEGALEIFKQNPLFGSGLGANLEYQERVHGKIINILDSTPFWLITETGIIGFLVFCVFYILVVRSIILKLKHDDDFAKFMRLSTLFMILTFTVMCIFHEILYTRHIWFILGIALTLPSKTRHLE